MQLRDEMFLTPAFQGELYEILETLSREETLCRLYYTPPGACSLYAETGRILEVGAHWMRVETYTLDQPYPNKGHKKEKPGNEQLYRGEVWIPTRSVTYVESGESAFRVRVLALLAEKKQLLERCMESDRPQDSGQGFALGLDGARTTPGFFSWLTGLRQLLCLK